jgi:hypothetical protein
VESSSGTSGDLAVLLAAGQSGLGGNPQATLPRRGTPGTFQSLPLVPDEGHSVVFDKIGQPGQPDRLTLLVVNPSLSEASGGIAAERWLLVPPENVKFERDAPPPDEQARHWTITWDRVGLQDFPQAFREFRIYRRQWGEPETAAWMISSSQERVYSDVAPDLEDYVYAVTVVDRHGNESHLSKVEKFDPFQGVWDGHLLLVEGQVAEPVVTLIEKKMAEWDEEERASISKIQDDQRRAEAQEQWRQTFAGASTYKDMFVELIRKGEEVLRLGVPFEFQIRRTGGEYYFKLTELVWGAVELPPEMQQELELVRTAQYTLEFKGYPTDVPENLSLPVAKLKLHRVDPEARRSNVIREDAFPIRLQMPEQDIDCTFRWVLTRQTPELP